MRPLPKIILLLHLIYWLAALIIVHSYLPAIIVLSSNLVIEFLVILLPVLAFIISLLQLSSRGWRLYGLPWWEKALVWLPVTYLLPLVWFLIRWM